MTRLPPLSLEPIALRAITPRRRAPVVPPLEPEEERSLLQSGMGMLQYLGRTLDKPGSAARGVIHGLTDLAQGQTPEWGGGLLNALPFSDTLGITNPEDTVSGRDLLENVGLLDTNQPGMFNSWSDFGGDVAGFATEVATDPLTWISGPLGTVTKSGKAALEAAKAPQFAAKGSAAFDDAAEWTAKAYERIKAGDLTEPMGRIESPASLIEGLEQGTRSTFGIKKNPFSFKDDGSNILLSLADLPGGKKLDKFAAKVLEATHYGLGDPLTQAISAPIRGLRAAFDVSAQGKFKTGEQYLADKAFRTSRRLNEIWDDFAPVAYGMEQDLMRTFKEIADQGMANGSPEQFNAVARYMAEMPYFKDVNDVRQYLGQAIANQPTPAVAAQLDDLSERFFSYIDQMPKIKNKVYDELETLGLPTPRLEQRDMFSAHGRRRATNVSSDLEARNAVITNVPGGTRLLNDVSRNPLFTAPTVRDVAGIVPDTGEVAKGLGVGTYVRPADRLNKGRITSIDEAAGTANVYFHNTKTGATSTKEFRLSELTPLERKPGDPLYQTISKEQLDKELVEALENNVNPVTGQLEKLPWQGANTRELQQRLLWHGNIRPELDKWRDYQISQITDPNTYDKQVAAINKEYDAITNEWLNKRTVKDSNGLTHEEPARIDELLDYFSGQPAEMRTKGLFPRQIFEDQAEYMKTTMSYLATMREVHRFMKEPGVMVSPTDPNAVPLSRAWAEAGYTRQGLKTFAEENPDLIQQLGGAAAPATQSGTRWIDDITERLGGSQSDLAAVYDELESLAQAKRPDEFGNLFISQKAAGVLQGYKRVLDPHYHRAFISMLDPMTNAYRFGLTVPFPAFHVRNRMSGVWSALAEGHVNPWELARASNEVAKHMSKGEGLSGEFLDFLKTSDLLKGNMGLEFGEDITEGLSKQGLFAGILNPLKSVNRKNLGSKLNPMNIPGMRKPVEGQEVAQNVLAEMAGNMTKYVEDLNRAGYAKALWDKGFSPSDIITQVRRTQFDYTEMSKMDQEVMRRIAPFWSWTKKNLPYQLKKLAENPGGPTSQTIRAITSRDEEKGYIPSFLRERNALIGPQNMPSWLGGQNDPNLTTYITQTGIPVEDFNKFIAEPGSGMLNRRTAQRLSAELHPLLGAALRQYSGVDPFSGRPLKHLESRTDPILEQFGLPTIPSPAKEFVDRAIQASPLSRFAGTVGQVLDPRKTYLERALNLGSGLRFAQYDAAIERARDIEKAQRKVAESKPDVWEFSSFYVPKTKQGPAADRARADVALLRQLEKVRRKLQEEREVEK